MTSKKSDPEPESVGDDRGRESSIVQRAAARENATTQEGVTPPENQDVNVPVENPETRP
jgi:hypothetical protein